MAGTANKKNIPGSYGPESFLPICKEDMQHLGWDQCDVILVSADAYVDHPGFAAGLLGRVLQSRGYRVGIIAQPDWRHNDDFLKLGRPRLFFGVSGGNIDSMVAHYTPAKKRRHEDAFSPGGRTGFRPDRPTIVYCNQLRRIFGEVPIVIGGIEASLRRFAHYDYWDDSVRHSMLIDSGADLLSYGMGERSLLEIAERLDKGETIGQLNDIRGTVFRMTGPLSSEQSRQWLELPSFDEVCSDKKTYARCFAAYYAEQDPIRGRTVCQKNGKQYIVQNPPSLPLSEQQMDSIYELPYTRQYHPVYKAQGGIPALQEVKFSITSHRGCFGECNFCSLIMHQGRIIQSRSESSILREVDKLAQMPDFKGYIHDIGGPSANQWRLNCEIQKKNGSCRNRRCLYPKPCPNLPTDQSHIAALLRQAEKTAGVKKVFVRSGIRYDLALADKSGQYLKELCRSHVSGQLKVAPEHVSPQVTRAMAKPEAETYRRFMKTYSDINRHLGKKQYLVPYFIASHPGCGLREMVELAQFIKQMGHYPQQVQDFTPTPMTAATCMYYTGYDPFTMEKIYCTHSSEQRQMQRALMQFNLPENREVVEKALTLIHRRDLIGYGPDCLIRPEKTIKNRSGKKQSTGKPKASPDNKHDRKNNILKTDGRKSKGRSDRSGKKRKQN